MAQFVQIPKDLYKVKDKFIAGLTKRQTIFFGTGLALGIIVYLICNKHFGVSVSTSCVVLFIIASPFFIVGQYEKNGVTLDVMLMNFIRFHINPQIRTYQTENIYTAIEEQIQLEKEMKMLETGKKPTKQKRKQ